MKRSISQFGSGEHGIIRAPHLPLLADVGKMNPGCGQDELGKGTASAVPQQG
jgi:hypothetical protein